MKIKDMLEKIDSLKAKAVELENLKKIQEGLGSLEKRGNHFEFVEHYGNYAERIDIPKKYTQRLMDVISQIADEIEEEFKADFFFKNWRNEYGNT